MNWFWDACCCGGRRSKKRKVYDMVQIQVVQAPHVLELPGFYEVPL